ncbi:hypothetical protein O3P69_000528 [Scylla paramamosain]|uniref:Uncharacterized protein n=1 Tax=Scylla paramamosain TaxID=85552 RepID=A0AAW0UU09_SCYPA
MQTRGGEQTLYERRVLAVSGVTLLQHVFGWAWRRREGPSSSSSSSRAHSWKPRRVSGGGARSSTQSRVGSVFGKATVIVYRRALPAAAAPPASRRPPRRSAHPLTHPPRPSHPTPPAPQRTWTGTRTLKHTKFTDYCCCYYCEYYVLLNRSPSRGMRRR